MEWGSFSAPPTELIDFRHDVPDSHLTPRRLYFDFLLPSHFFGSSVVLIGGSILSSLRFQMWISKDTRSFFRFGENVTEFHTPSQVGGTIHC